MRSIVSFDFVAAILVDESVVYPSIGVTPHMDGSVWTGLAVEVEHDEDDAPSEIVDAARRVLRDVLTLVGVGRGLEPALGTARVGSVSASVAGPTIRVARLPADACIVRSLRAMPSESLVQRLSVDPRLRRQAEALNAARAASDVVFRIRWSYMVLEQEQMRGGKGYTPPDDFRHLRNGVSHPELTRPDGVAYFQRVLGADFPDLNNPEHLEFLQAQALRLLDEASRIVKESFRGDEFWL